MKRILMALCALMVTAPAFATEDLEARVERLERQTYFGSVAFFLSGAENCGISITPEQYRSVFKDVAEEDVTTVAAVLSNGAIGRLYSMGQRNLPDGDYCRTVRQTLPEVGLSAKGN
ncbi:MULTISPECIES: hypothetical protein [unclassified Roseibium]|uniref:hypothetical protein n=1 Tax=unclassified Roseibium TaxID=2629323 RepID=UPI00273D0AAA|nr:MULTISPECIES: hypothetical protein [unclassified Roseibium]